MFEHLPQPTFESADLPTHIIEQLTCDAPFTIDAIVEREMYDWVNRILDLDKIFDSCLRERMEHTSAVLEAHNINKHDLEHVVTVAMRGALVYLATRGMRELTDPHKLTKMLLRVVIAGLGHDIDYLGCLPDAPNTPDAPIGKQTFHQHVSRGAKMMKIILTKLCSEMDDGTFPYKAFIREPYREHAFFKDDIERDGNIRAITRAILAHNRPNGGTLQTVVALEAERPEGQAIFPGDKLHFKGRAPRDLMQYGTAVATAAPHRGQIHDELIRDMPKRHRKKQSKKPAFVDAVEAAYKQARGVYLSFVHPRLALAVTDESMTIDRAKGQFVFRLAVDPQRVNQLFREVGATDTYDADWFVRDFQDGFRENFTYLSHSIEALLQDTYYTPNGDQRFRVEIIFPDGATRSVSFTETDADTATVERDAMQIYRHMLSTTLA